MTRSSSAWTGTLVAVMLLTASLMPDHSHAGYTSKGFPEFASQKDSLGPISIVADVMEVHDVRGKEKKVYLADCLRLGEGFLASFVEGMAEKGYQVQKRGFSVGVLARQDFSYRIYSTSFQDRTDDSESRLVQSPFYVDSTLLRNPESIALWSKVLSDSWIYEKKKDKAIPPIPEAVQLRELLGTDHLFVVRVTHMQVSTGNRVGMAMLGFKKEDSFSFSVAMIDCRSGEVLWSDWDGFSGPGGRGLKEGDVKYITTRMLKPMP